MLTETLDTLYSWMTLENYLKS